MLGFSCPQSYLMAILKRHGANREIDLLDTINLASIRAIQNHNPILGRQVQLLRASRPSTSLLQ